MEVRPGRYAVRSRRRAGRVGGQPPGAAARPRLIAFGLAMVLVGLAGVWLAGAHIPGHDVALWIALPLLVACLKVWGW